MERKNEDQKDKKKFEYNTQMYENTMNKIKKYVDERQNNNDNRKTSHTDREDGSLIKNIESEPDTKENRNQK